MQMPTPIQIGIAKFLRVEYIYLDDIESSSYKANEHLRLEIVISPNNNKYLLCMFVLAVAACADGAFKARNMMKHLSRKRTDRYVKAEMRKKPKVCYLYNLEKVLNLNLYLFYDKMTERENQSKP